MAKFLLIFLYLCVTTLSQIDATPDVLYSIIGDPEGFIPLPSDGKITVPKQKYFNILIIPRNDEEQTATPICKSEITQESITGAVNVPLLLMAVEEAQGKYVCILRGSDQKTVAKFDITLVIKHPTTTTE